MAEIGYGYGSEFQLLRFLGHHRKELNAIIKAQIPEVNEVKWFDYPYDKNRISLDGEFKGITILPTECQKKLENDWKEYWTGNTQNWDGVFVSKQKLFIVEAKAHLAELESSFGGKNCANRKKIENAMKETRAAMRITGEHDWLGKYYQLANRLAFLYFLRNKRIKSHLVYIYFLNGYSRRELKNNKIEEIENKSVKTKEEWKVAIESQYNGLGLNQIKIEDYLYEVFIDCEK